MVHLAFLRCRVLSFHNGTLVLMATQGRAGENKTGGGVASQKSSQCCKTVREAPPFWHQIMSCTVPRGQGHRSMDNRALEDSFHLPVLSHPHSRHRAARESPFLRRAGLPHSGPGVGDETVQALNSLPNGHWPRGVLPAEEATALSITLVVSP